MSFRCPVRNGASGQSCATISSLHRSQTNVSNGFVPRSVRSTLPTDLRKLGHLNLTVHECFVKSHDLLQNRQTTPYRIAEVWLSGLI